MLSALLLGLALQAGVEDAPKKAGETPVMKVRVFTTGLAAAGLAFTVVFAVNAALANGRIESAMFDSMDGPASHLTRAEAEGFVRDTNAWLTATLIAGLTTAVLSALSIWLWTL